MHTHALLPSLSLSLTHTHAFTHMYNFLAVQNNLKKKQHIFIPFSPYAKCQQMEIQFITKRFQLRSTEFSFNYDVAMASLFWNSGWRLVMEPCVLVHIYRWVSWRWKIQENFQFPSHSHIQADMWLSDKLPLYWYLSLHTISFHISHCIQICFSTSLFSLKLHT